MDPSVRHVLNSRSIGESSAHGAIPGLVAVLVSIRKQAEQVTMSKPVSSTSSCPLHQLLPPGTCSV